jgi:uncharacterized protein DUF1501
MSKRQHACASHSLFGRRDFIQAGALGYLGLGLRDYFKLRSVQAAEKGEPEISCILLWQSGGASQLDTFDMKPDAPAEIRGPFKPIATNVPGIQICEHLPQTARQTDKYAIIRSVTSREADHERAINYLLTGYPPLQTIEFPSMGSVVSKELGPRHDMPPYVAVPNTFPSYGAGFLGGAYNPFIAGDPNVKGYQVRDLKLPLDVDWQRVDRRRWLLQMVDQRFRQIDAGNEAATIDDYYARAYDLMNSPRAKKAFDIEEEPESIRNRYGRTPVGQGCLLARRLVEAGVRFVTVAKGWLNWDTHGNNFNTLQKTLLPEIDPAYATLLEDLHQRGLLDRTLVVLMGEFGRTPKVNNDAGRDHWSKVFTVCLAGAGVRGGQVIGASDATASEVKEKPIHVEDLLSTIYGRLGIDTTKEYHTPIGRPVKIVNGGQVISELF